MDPRDLFSKNEKEITAWHGVISKAPTDFSDPVMVILPDWDEHLQWGPCLWQSRDDVSLPAVGDVCLVVVNNRRMAWVVAWTPYG